MKLKSLYLLIAFLTILSYSCSEGDMTTTLNSSIDLEELRNNQERALDYITSNYQTGNDTYKYCFDFEQNQYGANGFVSEFSYHIIVTILPSSETDITYFYVSEDSIKPTSYPTYFFSIEELFELVGDIVTNEPIYDGFTNQRVVPIIEELIYHPNGYITYLKYTFNKSYDDYNSNEARDTIEWKFIEFSDCRI